MADSCFVRFGREIGLSEEGVQDFDKRIGDNHEAWRAMRELIIKSKRSDPIIFCLDDCLAMQYEHTLAMNWFSTHIPSTGQKRLGINEIFESSKGLSADYLRTVFVTVETIVFKIVHIELESQRKSYTRNDGGFNIWCQRLLDRELIDDETRDLARQFYKTRNEFAHTIQSIDRIRYKKQPLGHCYGQSGGSRDPSIQNYFVDDVLTLTDTLLDIFKPIQSKQIDLEKFQQGLSQIELS